MIKHTRVAYSLGLSASLDPNTYSGYKEMAGFDFSGTDRELRKLQKAFLKGYKEGLELIREVRRELHSFIVEGKWNYTVDNSVK